jgi:imidazolonepropionase-like amidohydrolase
MWIAARTKWIGIVWAGLLCGAVHGQESKTSGNDRNDTRVAQTGRKVLASGIVIENVTVISAERKGPLEHATVVIRDGKIAEIGTKLAVGPGAKRIDGRGKFLIPGLIDSHVHAGDLSPLGDDGSDAHPELVQALRAQVPRAFLAFGFTTVVDLNPNGDTLQLLSAAPIHPTFFHCGPGVRVPGGYTALRPPKDAEAAKSMNLVYDKTLAKDWPANLDPKEFSPELAVERAAADGSICVKTFVEPGFGGVFHWPVPSAEVLAEIRAEAKKRGLVFVVHATGVEGWRAAMDAHADVIAHGLWHWPGDRKQTSPTKEAEEVVHAAARAGIYVQPTMQVVYGDESVFDRSILNDPRLGKALPRSVIAYLQSDEGKKAWQATADEYKGLIAKIFGTPEMEPSKAMAIGPMRVMATTRLLQADGGRLLFGSDTPPGGGIGNPFGLNGRMELDRWFEAGVPLAQILRAATLDNAVAFGIAGDRGTIEVGKRADLLLLCADPLKTINAYDSIERIFVATRDVKGDELLLVN